jgi:hypothetical protein
MMAKVNVVYENRVVDKAKGYNKEELRKNIIWK